MCGLLMGYSFLITVISKPFTMTYFSYLGLPSSQHHTHGHHRSSSDWCVCSRQICFCCDDKYPGWAGLAVVVTEKHTCQLMNELDFLALFKLLSIISIFSFLLLLLHLLIFLVFFSNSTHSYYCILCIVTLEALRIYCCASRRKLQHGKHISVRSFQ